MRKDKLLFIAIILAFVTSCAMRSGRYVNTDGKWRFVEHKTGFMHNFGSPRVDARVYNFTDNGQFKWPVPASTRITSFFGARNGRHHDGIDIGAKTGTSIIASAAGVVSFSGKMRGYGNVVVIKHAGSYHTIYAHNHRNFAKKGQKVGQGEVIAKVGSTGRSTGPHLHFEIRKKNKVRNPASYIALVKKRHHSRKRK